MKKSSSSNSAARPSNKSLLVFGAVLAAIAVIVAAAVLATGNNKPKAAVAGCGPYRNDKTVTISGHVFKAETPYDQNAFNKGLGGRPCIESDEAMMFAFKNPGQYAFWMREMKFPIDVIWIGSDQRVAWAYQNISPSTYPNKYANPQGHPAQFVLELKANSVKQLNLKIGTPVSF